MIDITSTRNLFEFVSMTDQTRLVGLEDLAVPRKYRRQTTRNNLAASTENEQFERLIFVPFLDCSVRKFNSRFNVAKYTL